MRRELLADIVREGTRALMTLFRLYGNQPPPEYYGEESPQERVTTDETIEYQKRELAKELTLLEGHLQEGCKINQKPCDCCEKHPLKIEGLALEASGMSSDPVFTRLADWARSISPMTTEAASASGKYRDQYSRLAIEAREFRKAIMPVVQISQEEV